jgi:hypothetical protein
MSFDSTSSYSAEDDAPATSPDTHVGENGASRRLYQRFPIDAQLQICWEEGKGVRRQVRARAVDVSKFGIQVESERAIATGTLVNVFTANFSPIGRASVRHCTPKGMDYRIGLYMPDRFADDL